MKKLALPLLVLFGLSGWIVALWPRATWVQFGSHLVLNQSTGEVRLANGSPLPSTQGRTDAEREALYKWADGLSYDAPDTKQ